MRGKKIRGKKTRGKKIPGKSSTGPNWKLGEAIRRACSTVSRSKDCAREILSLVKLVL